MYRSLNTHLWRVLILWFEFYDMEISTSSKICYFGRMNNISNLQFTVILALLSLTYWWEIERLILRRILRKISYKCWNWWRTQGRYTKGYGWGQLSTAYNRMSETNHWKVSLFIICFCVPFKFSFLTVLHDLHYVLGSNQLKDSLPVGIHHGILLFFSSVLWSLN